jgi:hypothetical protein
MENDIYPIPNIQRESERKIGLSKIILGFSSLISFILGIFFLSYNITGNVISEIDSKDSGLIGAVLFIIGFLGAFVFFKER